MPGYPPKKKYMLIVITLIDDINPKEESERYEKEQIKNLKQLAN
jgi:hypothetical protein